MRTILSLDRMRPQGLNSKHPSVTIVDRSWRNAMKWSQVPRPNPRFVMALPLLRTDARVGQPCHETD